MNFNDTKDTLPEKPVASTTHDAKTAEYPLTSGNKLPHCSPIWETVQKPLRDWDLHLWSGVTTDDLVCDQVGILWHRIWAWRFYFWISSLNSGPSFLWVHCCMEVSCGSLEPKLLPLLAVACITNCKIPTICVMWCYVMQVVCVIHELLTQVQACWLSFRLFTRLRSVTRIAGKINEAFQVKTIIWNGLNGNMTITTTTTTKACLGKPGC